MTDNCLNDLSTHDQVENYLLNNDSPVTRKELQFYLRTFCRMTHDEIESEMQRQINLNKSDDEIQAQMDNYFCPGELIVK